MGRVVVTEEWLREISEELKALTNPMINIEDLQKSESIDEAVKKAIINNLVHLKSIAYKIDNFLGRMI
jgi:DNA-binding transcriptional regulator GbsR (MarR family)